MQLRDPRTLLGGAVTAAGAFVFLLFCVYETGPGRWLDDAALEGFHALRGSVMNPLAEAIRTLGDPWMVGLVGTALAAVALMRGRPRVAVFVLVLLAVTSVSSQVLKMLLEHQRYVYFLGADQLDAQAFPSGHATASMSLAIAAVVVAPQRVRVQAAIIGSAVAMAVGYAAVVVGGHFPSDVAGGYLLAISLAFGLLAGLMLLEQRFPVGTPHGSPLIARVDRAAELSLNAGTLGVLVAGGGLLGVVVGRPGDAIDFATRHTATTVVAAGLAATAVLLLLALAATLMRSR